MASRFLRCVLFAGVALTCMQPLAHAADTLKPDVAKALQQAQTALAAHKFAQAQDAVHAAEAVKGKTDYDDYVINQMGAAVATQAGDMPGAVAAYEKLVASPRTPAAMKTQMLMSEATMAYTAKDYPKAIAAIERYTKAAGPNPQMNVLLVQCYYLQKDYAGTIKALNPLIAADIAAGRKPAESMLQMLAASATALKDPSTSSHAYVLLAKYYPKKEYWALLLHDLVTNTKIPPALQLDVYRIRLAVGDTLQTRDFMEMTEIAMQMRMPQLALDLMNQGYAAGVLGQGAEAPRQAKLKAMVAQAATDRKAALAADTKSAQAESKGDELLLVGYNAVTFGDTANGLDLMHQAIAKGVADPGVATLHLGLAEMQGGKTQDAIKTLQAVPSSSSAYDIAQLWVLKLTQPPAK
ncbi:hypothetical protein K2X14_05275 [Acetobacter sp. TBRC 12305]|uniref:Tetratricopeptide repeat protein n=1 Tax=Acetobacter garciniae TaxID=2817435 RepID=A0A939KPX4_9PROT|nr:tetratricopeptide repeat protein [Acetobacter garciniae]MBO1324564.1 hypothetical protein [Acetobacter garciniae]MBX0344253.1 hypothetical protein [Acetobacter garciniae]